MPRGRARLTALLVGLCILSMIPGCGCRPASSGPATSTEPPRSSPPSPSIPPGCVRVLHTITEGQPLIVDIYTVRPYDRVARSIDGGPFLPAGWESRC